MFWGIAVLALIAEGLLYWLDGYSGSENGAWAALCGVLLLIVGIVAITSGQVVTKTDYATDIAGVGRLTKTTSNAVGFRSVITFPFECSNTNYTLATKKGKVTIESDDAEKLLAEK